MRALLAAVLLAAALPARADLFIVRHAEKKSPKMDKSLLSAKGLRRARRLATVLSRVDLRAVFCTEYERTRQTAAPAAAEHGLEPVALSSDDTKGLAARLERLDPREDVLVVGHSDTIPGLLKDLGVTAKVEDPLAGYDDLFVVALSSGRAVSFHRLRY
jgi:broad specificity phosphatase PhoE